MFCVRNVVLDYIIFIFRKNGQKQMWIWLFKSSARYFISARYQKQSILRNSYVCVGSCN